MPVPPRTLNLRYNPFGELDPHERAAVAVGPFEALAQTLRVPGTALQIIGQCGRGKSSHLFGLQRELPHATYSRVDRGGPRCTGGIYLMDEADHFGPVKRWWYLRRATSVAVATHADMSGFLRRVGYRVVDVQASQNSVDHVLAVAHRRIEAARLGAGAVPVLGREMVAELVREYGDDLRAIEGVLYDWVAGGGRVEV